MSFKMVETADSEEILVDETDARKGSKRRSKRILSPILRSFLWIDMLGKDGTGKTTFVRLFAGEEADAPANKGDIALSPKPQVEQISPISKASLARYCLKQINAAFVHAEFQSDVVRPMNIENTLDQEDIASLRRWASTCSHSAGAGKAQRERLPH